ARATRLTGAIVLRGAVVFVSGGEETGAVLTIEDFMLLDASRTYPLTRVERRIRRHRNRVIAEPLTPGTLANRLRAPAGRPPTQRHCVAAGHQQPVIAPRPMAALVAPRP